MKKIIVIFSFIFVFSVSIYSQQVQCPQGYVCITQEAANKVAENVRELQATKEKVTTLENALELEKKNTKEVQETAKKNEDDLKDRIHKTEIELAGTKGQLISKEQELVRLVAQFEFLLKNGRVKKVGLINIF